MNMRFLAAIILSIIAVLVLIGGMFFIGMYSVLIALACYFIVERKFKEYFWKSFIIGAVIGVPIGLFFAFSSLSMILGNMSSQEIQVAEGFEDVEVLWLFLFKSNGDLTLALENHIGSEIIVKRVFADIDQPIGFVYDIEDLSLSRYGVSNTTAKFPSLSGKTGSNYTLYVNIEYEKTAEPGIYFNSTGVLKGRRI